ncbi:MAG: hypothetical protein IPJ01_10400 [Micavibrio sp.]|nr:hypothetical protein [Micavibrio sp.]
MAITIKEKQQHLDSLISSQEDLKDRDCLTKTGVAYLDGLKTARQLIFGGIKINRKKIYGKT